MLRSRRSTVPFIALLVLIGSSLSASAATTEIRALLDLDNDVATGCSVVTVDGAFAGVEMIHTTTVATTGGLPTVTGISTQSCTDPGTNTFGPPVAINSPYAPPWAVGIGNGVGGTYVVESYLPLTGLVSGGLIHVGFETGAATSGDLDALLTSGGNPMLILVGAAAGAASIPTVGEWGLIILGLLLVITALLVMRNHPETRALMVIVVLLGGATVAYAAGFVLDGMTGDWTGEPQLGSDATGDAVAGDLAAVFAGVESNILFLRYDMVNFANTAPTADDQTVGTTADAPVAITLTGSDPEGDALNYTIETSPANGTLSGTAPNLTYTPDPGYFGPDAFTFSVDDGELASNVATVTINVVNDNTAPVVADQGFSVAENSPNTTVVGTVAASDADGDTLTYAITAGNGAGAFALDPSTGQLTVADTTQLDFETTTQFILTVQVTDDGNGNLSDAATITIDVTDVNETPVALGDGYATPEDTPLVVAGPGVLGNDTDPDGDALTAVLDANVTNGTLVLNADGSFTYTPNLNFNGADGFTYHANDGGLDSNVVTVAIAVSTINDTPMAVDDAYATVEDTVLNIVAPGVLANDVDAESDPLTVTAFDATSAQGATVNVNADGSFSYDPTGAAALQALDDGESVNDTFTYTISDGVNPATATVTVTVSGLNDAPVATDDAYTTAEDTALNVTAPGVLGNDTDVDVEPLAVVLDTTVTNGTLALNAGGSFTYTPNPNYNGSDSFTYRANDGTANSNVATVTITVTADPDPPVAVDDAYATDEDTVLNVPASGVLANDTDPESDPLAVTAFDAVSAQGATVGVNADGSFSYDPTGAAALQGLDDTESVGDTFTYTIGDGNGGSDTATVTVTVSGVNDAPVATDDAYVTDEDTPMNIVAPGVLGNDTDVDVEAITVVLVSSPSNASSFTLNADGSFSYTPNPNYNGPDGFTYRANDGTANSNVATVTITVNSVNDPPIAAADTYSGAGNVAAGNTQFAAGGATPTAVASVSSAQSIAANDFDPDAGDTLTYSVASSNTTNGGTVLMNTDGSFLYTPPSNPAIASDTFTYTVTDTGLLTDTAVVTITIEDFVWYVDNSNTTAPFNGTSTDPFQTLTAAESASAANQTIYVFQGDSGTTPYTAGITLQDGQKLFGEGVDLVVTLASSPVTLVTGNVANKPVVRTTTPSVTVDSTSGAMQNIEIHGLDLGNTATADTVSITEVGNPVSVALSVLDLNTSATGGTPAALSINGGGASTMHVTEMQNIVVTQSGSAVNGIVVTEAVFDANPADADFTGDTVSGGTITIGTSGARLGGTGLSLQNVSGDLSITDLDVFTAGATALDVTGSGLVNIGAGSGFQFATGAASTLDATSGAAMIIDPATLALTFSTVTSSGSGTSAVLLQSVAGTVTMGGGSLSNATGPLFQVLGGTVSTTFSGSISQGSNAAAVSVSGGHSTGTLLFETGTISATSGTGLQFDNADGTYNFTGTVTLGGGDAGIDIVNGSSGTINISSTGSSITNPSGTAVNVNASDPAFTYAGSVSQSNAARLVMFGNNTGGSATLSGNLSATGASTGILLLNNFDGAFTFSGGTKTVNTGANAAVTADGNIGSTIDFTGGGLGITTTSGAGVSSVSGGTISVTGSGNTITTTTGTAVFITNTIGAGGVTFATVSTSGAANGILLNAVGANPFTASGGSIVNASTRGVDINGGTGNVSIGSTISTTAAGRSVEVTGHTGGTVTFSGAIDDNGLGINLDSNTGGTVTFSGGLDIDSATNTGFNATNGGTVQATQNNTTIVNTVDTTTGTAVNIQNTTIGASGVTFRSVSSNGAANGIVLNATGSSGSFLVSGDGSQTAGVYDRDGSGGTIQNTTSSGVVLTSANNVTLRQMNFSSNGDHAVVTTGGSNQTLSAVTITNPTNHGWEATDLAGTNRIDHGSLVTQFNGINQDGVRLVNTSTSFTAFTVDGSTFSASATGNDGFFHRALGTTAGAVNVSDSTFTGLNGDGVQIANDGSGTVTSTITGNTFTTAKATDGNNGLALNLGGTGIHQFTVGGASLAAQNIFTDVNRIGDNSGVINVTAAGAGTGSTSRIIGTIQNNSVSNTTGRRGISTLFEASGGTGHGGHSITITGNTINNIAREGIYVGMSSVASRTNTGNLVTITNNQVGTTSVVSNAGNREGIEVEGFHDGSGGGSIGAAILVQGNTVVTNNTDETFRITNDAFIGGATNLQVTVLGNTFTNNDVTGDSFEVRSWDAGSTTCLDVNAANVAGNRNNSNRGYLIARSGGTFNMEGMGAGPNTNATVNTFVDARNDGGASAASGDGFTGGVTCSTP